MTQAHAPASSHRWNFFRSGGLDQVALHNSADLLALDQLDQKLWVALSCPVKGLELDPKTLALVDTDGDGHIRVPELIAAVKWAAARLREPADLLRGAEFLSLSALNESTPEGKTLGLAARHIISDRPRRESELPTAARRVRVADAIYVDEASAAVSILSAHPPIGDGIITIAASDDPAVQNLIKDIIATVGGTPAHTGTIGVTTKQITAFFEELNAYRAWIELSAADNVAVLGAGTDAAAHAVRAVRAKIDDYFGRCRLAAFDVRATVALNRSEAEYLAIAAKDLNITAAEVSGFPLARIEAHRALPLLDRVNPAWADAISAFHAKVVVPILGAEKDALTETGWQAINARLAPYEAWLGSKPASAVEKLGAARMRAIFAGGAQAGLDAVVTRDLELSTQFQGGADIERLVRYHRDLRALLHNFVNFADFYSRDRYAVFQAGTLYLDSRSTELCVRVDAPHPLAAMSKAYIAYIACTRAGSPAMAVAACFTQGDSDYLFVGRHGIFYDRAGNDWEAVITSIVDNPISLRQAFWSPYKKFVRMIDEMIAKRAAAADAAASSKLASAATNVAHADQLAADKAKLAEPRKVDVGTVAALGVAVGAIGGALAAVSTGLARLEWWQLPLVLIGLVLAISLPSVIIAWLKLRQRTLGPILDANGWAINGRVKINIPFGSALTAVATLPEGSHRSLVDPYEDKEAAAQKRRVIFLAFLLVLAGVAIWLRWDRSQRGRYIWEPAPAAAPVAPATVVPQP